MAPSAHTTCAADPPLSAKPERELSRGGENSRVLGRSFRIRSSSGSNRPLCANSSICAACCTWRRARLSSAMGGGER